MNIILTNGVKLKYLMTPNQSINSNQFMLVSIDASPVESALESYLNCEE